MKNLTLIKNIKLLVQTETSLKEKFVGKEMENINSIENAFLTSENGLIHSFGKMEDIPAGISSKANLVVDATGKMVFPSFCDSHTHLVYAGSREIEYGDKIKGLTYEEIAKRGGGILNSAKLLNETSEEELYRQAVPRIKEIISQGTGAVEIKSGYGLNFEAELKMLRVIKRLKETMPIVIKSTFLAAHAVPAEYKGRQAEYVDYAINEILPQVAKENLAEYIDVFCDKGFFTVEETERILAAGQKVGLVPKIHANELDYSGGIQAAVKYNALSADHLEYTGDAEIEAFKSSATMPTILPGAAFFLNLPYAPARKMIDSGLPVAIASDFNPGSSPSGNMKLMMTFASVNHRMTARETLSAATINSAYAMGVSDILGSIAVGKKANFFITKEIPTLEFFTYSYGSNLIDQVFIDGEVY